MGAFMRIAVVAAAICLSMVGLATADSANAAVRKPTHIEAQRLGAALKELAQSRGLQVLYLSNTVRDVRTQGATGDITANEAFDQLLTGTGLTYRYLDENTVTVVPLSDSSFSEGAGVSLRAPVVDAIVAGPSDRATKTDSSERLLLAQAVPASAQQEIPAPAESQPLQEIIVTGSRIAAPNEVSTSPIQVLSSKYIEVSGKTDITDIISLLPQNFTNDLGQDLGNGTSGLSTAGGVATADLRGIGPQRTLVLVDGRRLGVGSPQTAIAPPAPDLDQIPAGLVERVEVVTGGASAAYGSDAIAGVVNFIMKKNFEGFQVDGQLGENWHDNGNTYLQGLVRQFDNAIPAIGTAKDGRNRTFDMLMGTNFADGKGNVTAYLSFRHADPVVSSQRDFGGCQLFPVTDNNGNVTGTVCNGSSNSNYFRPVTGPNAGTAYAVSGTSFVPWGTVPTSPPAAFNSQPYIYMTREDDRYNAAVLAHQEITDWFKPYAEFYFMDDKSHQVIAPAALFRDANPLDPTGLGDYFINCSNPLLSAQQKGTLCTPAQITADTANPGSATAQVRIGRRNVEGGGRFSDYNHENYRAVFGAQGDFAEAWNYDIYGQYSYTTFFGSNNKYESFANIDNALLATGTAANPKCIGNNRGCIPYNIFSDGGVTAAQLNYLYLTGTNSGTAQLRTIHADVTGKLGTYGVKSPVANEGVGVNIGFEHRNDHEIYTPDAVSQSGLLSGSGGAQVPLDASESVKEEFLEIRAPLVQDHTGAKDLLFDTGYRRSDYSITGVTNTYKFEVQYAPIEDYRLRVSYDRAVRAPSIVELFNAPNVNTVAAFPDPCAPPITFTLAQCLNTGATAAQYNSGSIPQGTAGQLSQETRGNRALRPERADTYTFGLNFTPSQLPHFTGSIDYYHIRVKDEVNVIPLNVIMNTCANTGDPTFCSQIVRTPGSGGLVGNDPATGGFIVQKNFNIGTALVSGIDLQLAYRLDLPPGFGGLQFEMNGAYLQHQETTPLPGQHTYDCAGLFGFTCQTVNPRWHHIFRTTWQMPWDVSASMSWRYLSKVSQDNNTADPTLHFSSWGAYDYFNATIPSFSYLDLEATWNVNKILQLRAGANNILDKDPPVINSALVANGAANTYSVYDMLGRQLFVAFRARF
jgi:iron complex outermembrane recepter protein